MNGTKNHNVASRAATVRFKSAAQARMLHISNIALWYALTARGRSKRPHNQIVRCWTGSCAARGEHRNMCVNGVSRWRAALDMLRALGAHKTNNGGSGGHRSVT